MAAGDRLVRDVFTRDGRCRLCGALFSPQSKARYDHAAKHLRALAESRLLERDRAYPDRPLKRVP